MVVLWKNAIFSHFHSISYMNEVKINIHSMDQNKQADADLFV